MTRFTFSATVRGGFPVQVVAYAIPADPSVGYPGDIEIEQVLTPRGRPADFLQLTRQEEAGLLEGVSKEDLDEWNNQ